MAHDIGGKAPPPDPRVQPFVVGTDYRGTHIALVIHTGLPAPHDNITVRMSVARALEIAAQIVRDVDRSLSRAP